MICDECVKKDVCRLKEQCNSLEEELNQHKIEDAITLTASCKHRETKQACRDGNQMLKINLLGVNPRPQPYPKSLLDNIRYCENKLPISGGDFRDDCNQETQEEYFGKRR